MDEQNYGPAKVKKTYICALFSVHYAGSDTSTHLSSLNDLCCYEKPSIQIPSLEILPTFATKEETLAFLENNNLEILFTFNSVRVLVDLISKRGRSWKKAQLGSQNNHSLKTVNTGNVSGMLLCREEEAS